MGKNGGICDLTTVDVGGKQKGEYGERFVAVDGHSGIVDRHLLPWCIVRSTFMADLSPIHSWPLLILVP
jgi:hypothetical protein